MSTPSASGFDVDLLAEPWRYPGPVPTTSGLAQDGGFQPGDVATIDAALRGARSAPMRDRHAVVAVGANASPGVVRTKLAGVDPLVPMVRAVLADVAVGHSAHLSLPGYVAAAPYRRPGARTRVMVTFLTDPQLDRLDQTEPNYTRRRLVAGLQLDDGSRPGGPLPSESWPGESWLYVSRRGVIALPGGAVVPLGTQAELWAALAAVDVVLRSFAAPDGAPARREAVRERLLELRMVRPSGLAHLAPAAWDRP